MNWFREKRLIVTNWFKALSVREKQLIISCVLIVLGLSLYLVSSTIIEAFQDINARIARKESDLENVSQLLAQYSKLKVQRDLIESEFKSVEFKEGELSYLEQLIQRKLNLIQPSVTISPRSAVPFGTHYEQAPFTIKFKYSDLKTLLGFLSDLVAGAQPLLITRLDIQITRTGDAMDVDMDVSSIHQAKGPTAQ